MLTTVIAGVTAVVNPTQVEAAAKKGWQKINGKQYYILQNGSKAKGLVALNGRKYYFDKKTGEQKKGWQTIDDYRYYFGIGNLKTCKPQNLDAAVGWRQDGDGNRRYFNSQGHMVTQWFTMKDKKYYFDKSTGIMKKGWLYLGDDKYYFNTKTGIMASDVMLKDTKKNIVRYFNPSGRMARGWKTFPDRKCYFISNLKSDRDGAMAIGFHDIDGKTYYFYSKTGDKVEGWLTMKSTGKKYYLNPDNGGVLVKNTEMEIDGVLYVFDEEGAAVIKVDSPDISQPTGKRTIKNYLAGALQPVGQTLYVWGGGWNQTDSTRKGVSSVWRQWYDSQDRDYNYENYMYQSEKGFDCSGFVGWSTYQAMHSKSGEGNGYTVVASEVCRSYAGRGWGKLISRAELIRSGYRLQAGDVGCNLGHTWIVLGQCEDKSAVIVHSTPNAGCQISGTPTPDGKYPSQAIMLAREYMSRYPGYNKFEYHPSSGDYINNSTGYFRWNSNTLSDPEGYKSMTAEQILADLFG